MYQFRVVKGPSHGGSPWASMVAKEHSGGSITACLIGGNVTYLHD